MMILGSISSGFLFLDKDFLVVSNDLFFKISYFFEFP